MSALIFGLALIGALMWGARYYNTIPPPERARMLRRAGAALAFIVALGLAATGRAFLAVPLAFFGGLLLWRRPKFGTATERLAGGPRLSSVRTAFLEMTLDQVEARAILDTLRATSGPNRITTSESGPSSGIRCQALRR